jgi:hypothetical protein
VRYGCEARRAASRSCAWPSATSARACDWTATPGVVFRDGAAGRRAVVVGGPDVWEVIAAARSAPERGEELIRALSERTGAPVEKIRIAIRYYAEYPDEVDRFIAANEEEAEQLERALENERRLLG